MRLKGLSLLFVFLSFAALAAGDFTNHFTTETASPADTVKLSLLDENNEKVLQAEKKLSELYQSIDYGAGARPAYEVFRKGMLGYLNLLSQNKLSDKGLLTLIDFSLPSVEKRMWVLDLKTKKVLYYDYVAHGKNSGGNMATAFSNTPESLQSSLGFYVTAETYIGKHGLSLRLNGYEAGFNDKAMERAIVMHGADYVNTSIIKSMGRLGRSFGCPAVSRAVAKTLIPLVANRTCLFIYHPSADYLAKSDLLKEEAVIDYFLASNI